MKGSPGQSLVEVIVAVGMMALLLVALLSLMSLSVKNSRLARDRAQAVSLAQGGVELIRAYRDFSWNNFAGAIRSDAYDLPDNWVVENNLTNNCVADNYLINDLFSRCVTLSQVGIDADIVEIEVEVVVYWQEGSQVKTSQQLTRLSKWER